MACCLTTEAISYFAVNVSSGRTCLAYTVCSHEKEHAYEIVRLSVCVCVCVCVFFFFVCVCVCVNHWASFYNITNRLCQYSSLHMNSMALRIVRPCQYSSLHMNSMALRIVRLCQYSSFHRNNMTDAQNCEALSIFFIA
jgi:hypothetical protein